MARIEKPIVINDWPEKEKEVSKMLFLITQTHTPETCPKEKGGSRTLYNPEAEGVTLKSMYGAFAQHIIYYIVEADDLAAVNRFLDPGWLSCTSTITPVAAAPIQR